MGQGDIIRLLEKEKQMLSTKQIADRLNVGISCTVVKLKKLKEGGYIEAKKRGKKYFYKLKKR